MNSDPVAEIRSLGKAVRGLLLLGTLFVCYWNARFVFGIHEINDFLTDDFGYHGEPIPFIIGGLKVISISLPLAAVAAVLVFRSHRLALYSLAAILFVAVFQIFFGWQMTFGRLTHQIGFRHEILKALASAKEVRVVEHSCPYDFPKLPADQYHEKIYGTVVLDRKQLNDLYRAFPFTLGYGRILMCGFAPHHRIEAIQPDGSIFPIELCFKCGELTADGKGQRVFPGGWYATLKQFIDSLGMHPDGPWE